jgi:hypothetical protein
MSRVIERARPDSRISWRRAGRFLWESLWVPFWLGSTLPPPALPGRREPVAAAGERTPLILRQLDDLRATIWRQRLGILLFRALWLAFLALDIWLVFRVVADRALPPQPFALAAIAALAGGAVLIALARPTRGQLARTLDRSFGLRERVATALEESQGRDRLGGVRALQILDATRVTRDVGRASAFRRRLPVREIVMAIVTAALCVVLLILLIVREGVTPGGENGSLPGANPSSQSRGAQPGNDPTAPNNQNNPNGQQGPGNSPGQQPGGQQGQPSAQGRQDLDTLAGALGEHAATREAADRLRNGDYAGAAQAMREAGANAGQLSPQERQGLASDLRGAAGQVSDPQLAQDLRDLADQLNQPGANGAQGAADQVAQDIERIANGDQAGQGQQGQGQQGQNGQQGNQGQQGQGAGQSSGSGSGASPQLPGQQRQTTPQQGQSSPLLGADGKPVELPKGNNNGPQINTQNPNNRGNGQTDPGAAGAGGGQVRQGEVGDAGVDSNQVPIEQRGAIERYFTPRPADPDNDGE